MRTPNSFDSLDPIPSKLGCKLEAPRSISKERRRLVDNWIFETADHRLVVDLPTLTCQEVTESDCRQIKTKSEYNTFIERQKELVKEAAQTTVVGLQVVTTASLDGLNVAPLVGTTITVRLPKRYVRTTLGDLLPSVVQSGDE
jgi:hypothetical protein